MTSSSNIFREILVLTFLDVSLGLSSCKLKPFLLHGVFRHVIRVNANKEDKCERRVGVLTGLQLLNFHGGGGSEAASPIKKRSRGGGSVDDDDVVQSCGDDDDVAKSCGDMNNAYDSCNVEIGRVKSRRKKQASSETVTDDDDDQERALVELRTSL